MSIDTSSKTFGESGVRQTVQLSRLHAVFEFEADPPAKTFSLPIQLQFEDEVERKESRE